MYFVKDLLKKFLIDKNYYKSIIRELVDIKIEQNTRSLVKDKALSEQEKSYKKDNRVTFSITKMWGHYQKIHIFGMIKQKLSFQMLEIIVIFILVPIVFLYRWRM